MAKILAINGSPRKNGNTKAMLEAILKSIGEGIEKELINVSDYALKPCDSCFTCFKKNGECRIKDDMKVIVDKMLQAKAIIIGSPVYFGSVTPEIRMICDRTGFMAWGKLENKIGVPVTVARRWGHISAMQQIVTWMLNVGMIVIGQGGGWTSATARDIGEFEKDEEGVGIAKKMGRKIRILLEKFLKKKLYA